MEEEFVPVDVFQVSEGVITQVDMVGVNTDPIVQMLVFQTNLDYIIIAMLFLAFCLYLINWGAKLWRQ